MSLNFENGTILIQESWILQFKMISMRSEIRRKPAGNTFSKCKTLVSEFKLWWPESDQSIKLGCLSGPPGRPCLAGVDGLIQNFKANKFGSCPLSRRPTEATSIEAFIGQEVGSSQSINCGYWQNLKTGSLWCGSLVDEAFEKNSEVFKMIRKQTSRRPPLVGHQTRNHWHSAWNAGAKTFF